MKTVRYFALGFVLLGLVAGASAEGKTRHENKSKTPLSIIAFSAPADESSVSSTISVRAASSQVDSVKAVTFFVDGEQLAQAKGSAGAFKWDTTKVGDGWHTLTAIAEDSKGKQTEADLAVRVHNFIDKIAPTIVIEWPMDGETKSNVMTTRVHVTDNIGVTSVETYIDGQLVGTSNSAPFDTKWKWNKLAKGTHTFVCKAYDAAGNVAVSSPVKITK